MNYSTALLSRPPLPGEFCGMLPGLEPTFDAKAWPSLVKTSPPIYAKGDRYSTPSGNTYTAKGGEKVAVGVQKDMQSGAAPGPSRVVLTAAEREWLGASVRLPDGRVAQVWALAPISGCEWVVANGYRDVAHTDALELVQSRVVQLALDV